uniref:Uncharacterized protein n=1 Tax=Arundo donax TaxID=35708 RepID=A0A0A9BSI9_ARUDO
MAMVQTVLYLQEVSQLLHFSSSPLTTYRTSSGQREGMYINCTNTEQLKEAHCHSYVFILKYQL